MRDVVKVRSVAGTVVISIPKRILKSSGLKQGDRVVLESKPFGVVASKWE